MDSIGFRGQCLSVLQNGKAEKMSRKDQKIYCNCCGKMICLLSEKDRTSFLTVEKEWGYFSDKKTGVIHRMDIVSPAEKMVEKFHEASAIRN